MNAILYAGEHSRTFDARWHSHEYWELIYCTSGQGSFRMESGRTLHYRKGQAVAIPPKQAHLSSSDEGFTNIHLTMDAPAFPYKSAFLVDDDHDGHMGAAFSQAKYYYLSELKGRELVLSALGELITSCMIVFRDNHELSGPVEHIRSSIIRNFSNPAYELDQEILQMPFNYDYLRRLFQKKIGLTPLQYMTDLRMNKAKSMLTAAWTREYSVAEVAESCGYADALYFSRVFKKHCGCSPSEFIKHHRDEEGEARREGWEEQTDPPRREGP